MMQLLIVAMEKKYAGLERREHTDLVEFLS